MMNTYTIPQKMSGEGSIHDIDSDMFGRTIKFPKNCEYAVVLSNYYGGRGYTTHQSVEAVIAASRRKKDFSHAIIDTRGNKYSVNCGQLDRLDSE